MPWSTLAALSTAIAVSLTTLELLVAGYFEPTNVWTTALLYRILLANTAVAWLLCFTSGKVGGWLHSVVGLSAVRAGVAGALAPVLPWGLYMSGSSPIWLYGENWLWFVVAVGASFSLTALLLKIHAPPAVEAAILAAWPAVAPIAVWTRYVQTLHQTPGQMASALLAAAIWAIGTLALAGATFRRPQIGHIAAIGSVAVVLLGALGPSASIDLNQHDTLLSSADPAAGPIILLTVDTLRQDALSLYGSATPTPAIDALGADGIVFDRAFSTAPWTYVSFASIHSGLTPWAHGIHFPWDRIHRDVAALAPLMRDRGYHTTSLGSSLLMTPGAPADPFVLSFSDRVFFPRRVTPQTKAQAWLNYLDPNLLDTSASTVAVGKYAEEWADNHAEEPFFLWLHFLDPHSPYDLVEEFPPAIEPTEYFARATPKSLDILQHREKPMPGLKEWSQALYCSEVQGVDHAIGKFLAALKENGIYDKALIILTSDHGEEFAEHNNYGHGQSLYNELVRVPLVVKLPNSKVAARVQHAVSTVAVAPTIFDLADIPYEEDLFSARSLRRAWQDPDISSPVEPVFMTGVGPSSEPAEAVVWENYKLIRWVNMDHVELYDIDSDPYEQHNVSHALPEQVAIGEALLAGHAVEESRRAEKRGFRAPSQEPLAPDQERLLRGLGYLQ